MKKIAAILSILAGILHASYVAIEHWSEFPQLEFGFFVSIGLAQIIWGAWLLHGKSSKKLYTGIALNGSILIAWILTRTVRAPFQEGTEAIGALDSAMAAMEIAVIAILSAQLFKNAKNIQKIALSILIAMIGGGAGLYGSGIVMELIFPDRVFTHTHGNEEMHKEILPNHENTQNVMDDIHKDVEDDHGHAPGDVH